MPDFICELDIRDPMTNERLAPPSRLYVTFLLKYLIF